MHGLFLALLAGATAAPQPVTMTGGFQAEAHREIASGADSKAMVYSVLGSIRLAIGKAEPQPLSVECLGFDETGKGGATVGEGRCVWKDAAGDALYVSLATKGSGNSYTVTGGTGKWAGASGELVTSFAYLPAPEGVLLLSEAGSGQLSTPNY